MPDCTVSNTKLSSLTLNELTLKARERILSLSFTIFEHFLRNPLAKFLVEPPLEGERKVYINGPGHMTKMAVMPIYGKSLFKLFFLQNRKTYDPVTVHAASKTQALQSYINVDPGLTFTYFTARSS